MSVWDGRKEIWYGNESVGKVSRTRLPSVKSMALSAIVVESEKFTYLQHVFLKTNHVLSPALSIKRCIPSLSNAIAFLHQKPPRPKDYLILSIINILCCFWPAGLWALLKSTQVRDTNGYLYLALPLHSLPGSGVTRLVRGGNVLAIA